MKSKLGAKTRAVADELGVTTPESVEPSQELPEEMQRQIREIAYYKAQARGFAPGRELDDWLEAEAEVRERRQE
jgi:hypothetical protein